SLKHHQNNAWHRSQNFSARSTGFRTSTARSKRRFGLRPKSWGVHLRASAQKGNGPVLSGKASLIAAVNRSRNRMITEANEGNEGRAIPKQGFQSDRMLGNLDRMLTLAILAQKRGDILSLAERYRTGDVRVFGSVARGHNTEAS